MKKRKVYKVPECENIHMGLSKNIAQEENAGIGVDTSTTDWNFAKKEEWISMTNGIRMTHGTPVYGIQTLINNNSTNNR